MGRALSGQPVEERQGDLLAHDPVVAPRGEQRRTPLPREGDTRQLANELADPPPVRRLDLAAQLMGDQAARLHRIVADADAGVPAERVGEQHVGRAGAERIAVTDQHRARWVLVAQPPEHLVAQARLADAGRTDDEGRLGDALVDGGRHRAFELDQLQLSADARGRLAEQGPAGVEVGPLPNQDFDALASRRAGVSRIEARGGDETPIEQLAREVVEQDGVTGNRALEDLHRAIDRLAEARAWTQRRAPSRHGDPGTGHLLAQVDRAPRSDVDQIGGARPGQDRREQRAIGQAFDGTAEPMHRASDRLEPIGARDRARDRGRRRAGQHHQNHADQHLIRRDRLGLRFCCGAPPHR